MKQEIQSIIKDMRPGYGSQIVISTSASFAGFPITELRKSETSIFPQKNCYDVICSGWKCGEIFLSEDDYKTVIDAIAIYGEQSECEEKTRKEMYCVSCQAMHKEECCCSAEWWEE